MHTTDAIEAQLRQAVEAATATFNAAVRALTPAASLAMMETPARGPFGARPEPTAEQLDARQRVETFQSADKALVAAKAALNAYRRERIEEDRQVGLRQLAERTARKEAALTAAGIVFRPGQDTRSPLPSGGRVR